MVVEQCSDICDVLFDLFSTTFVEHCSDVCDATMVVEHCSDICDVLFVLFTTMFVEHAPTSVMLYLVSAYGGLILVVGCSLDPMTDGCL
jgi:hypothetical protein